MTTVVLGSGRATAADVAAVARGARAVLADGALEAVADCHRRLLALAVEVAVSGESVYGVTTGVGDLVDTVEVVADHAASQMALLRSHASGIGAPHDDEAVRAVLAVLVEALAQGRSGVRPELVFALVDMLNAGVVPHAPSQGSVGYLTGTAHIGLVVFGEGRARWRGELLPGAEALARAGLEPLTPGPREGHALVSGTYETSALGALAVDAARRLVDVADAAGALTVEAAGRSARGFDERVIALRPHPGQVETARRLRHLLAGSTLISAGTTGRAGPDEGRLQDALSMRCLPQVHGAFRDCLAWVTGVVETEVRSVTDNPAFVLEDDELVALSSGNGHGAPVALALDALAVAVSHLTSMSAARSDRLTTHRLSGLPAFLAPWGGSGHMIPPYAAAAVSAQVRSLAAPASVHSVTTCAGQEDHVSMGTSAAVEARTAVAHAEHVVAVELLCAAQGIDLRASAAGGSPGAGSTAVLSAVRGAVPLRTSDGTEVADDLAAVHALVAGGSLHAVVTHALSTDPGGPR